MTSQELPKYVDLQQASKTQLTTLSSHLPGIGEGRVQKIHDLAMSNPHFGVDDLVQATNVPIEKWNEWSDAGLLLLPLTAQQKIDKKLQQIQAEQTNREKQQVELQQQMQQLQQNVLTTSASTTATLQNLMAKLERRSHRRSSKSSISSGSFCDEVDDTPCTTMPANPKDQYLSDRAMKDMQQMQQLQSAIPPDGIYHPDSRHASALLNSKHTSDEFTRGSFFLNNGTIVHVYQADITRLGVGVIINPANTELDHCGGLAQQIKDKAGGKQFQQISTQMVHHNGIVPVSKARYQDGLNLPCCGVIHAVGPRASDYDDDGALFYTLQSTYANAFMLAENYNAHSLATPLISSGVFAVTEEIAIAALCESLAWYGERVDTTIQDIHVVDINAAKIGRMGTIIQGKFPPCDDFIQIPDLADKAHRSKLRPQIWLNQTDDTFPFEGSVQRQQTYGSNKPRVNVPVGRQQSSFREESLLSYAGVPPFQSTPALLRTHPVSNLPRYSVPEQIVKSKDGKPSVLDCTTPKKLIPKTSLPVLGLVEEPVGSVWTQQPRLTQLQGVTKQISRKTALRPVDRTTDPQHSPPPLHRVTDTRQYMHNATLPQQHKSNQQAFSQPNQTGQQAMSRHSLPGGNANYPHHFGQNYSNSLSQPPAVPPGYQIPSPSVRTTPFTHDTIVRQNPNLQNASTPDWLTSGLIPADPITLTENPPLLGYQLRVIGMEHSGALGPHLYELGYALENADQNELEKLISPTQTLASHFKDLGQQTNGRLGKFLFEIGWIMQHRQGTNSSQASQGHLSNMTPLWQNPPQMTSANCQAYGFQPRAPVDLHQHAGNAIQTGFQACNNNLSLNQSTAGRPSQVHFQETMPGTQPVPQIQNLQARLALWQGLQTAMSNEYNVSAPQRGEYPNSQGQPPIRNGNQDRSRNSDRRYEQRNRNNNRSDDDSYARPRRHDRLQNDSESDDSNHRGRPRRRPWSRGPSSDRERRRSPPMAKMPIFNGEDWVSFFFQFKRTAQSYSWDDQKKLDKLLSSLRGKAVKYIRNRPDTILASYDSLSKDLTKRFDKKEPQGSVRTALTFLKQKTDEDLEDFADQVQDLVLDAYNKVPDSPRENIAVDAFLKGCRDIDLARQVVYDNPSTLAKAVEKMKMAGHAKKITPSKTFSSRQMSLDEESSNTNYDLNYVGYDRSRSPNKSENYSGNWKANRGSNGKVFSKNFDHSNSPHRVDFSALEAKIHSSISTGIVEALKQIQSYKPSETPKFPTTRSPSPSRKENSTCYRCGRKGHFSRECPEKYSPGRTGERVATPEKNLNSH